MLFLSGCIVGKCECPEKPRTIQNNRACLLACLLFPEAWYRKIGKLVGGGGRRIAKKKLLCEMFSRRMNCKRNCSKNQEAGYHERIEKLVCAGLYKSSFE